MSNKQNDRLDRLAEALVPEAIEYIKELRRYREYEGADARYLEKARVGLTLIGSSVRLCATIENNRHLDMAAERLPAAREVTGEEPKKLKAAG